MVAEQDRTLEVLQIAIKMEIDGKEYYLKTSQESGNDLGKKLLQSLAAEEDIHRKNFEEIYDAIRKKKSWPTTDFQPDGGKSLRTTFAMITEEIGPNLRASNTELDAIQIAIDMENKTYDFYKSKFGDATFDAERDFYEALVAEEREHQLILIDYHEYLKDPVAWFAQKEHPSLDGG